MATKKKRVRYTKAQSVFRRLVTLAGTQAAAGKLVGRSQVTIHGYVAGTRTPRPATLRKAEALVAKLSS